MSKKTTIPISKEFRNELKSGGAKGESCEDIIKRRMVDVDAVAQIAADQRALTEAVKKGIWHASEHEAPEGISEAEYLTKSLELINRLRMLCGDKPVVWKKTKVGGFEVLVPEDEPEPESWESHQREFHGK